MLRIRRFGKDRCVYAPRNPADDTIGLCQVVQSETVNTVRDTLQFKRLMRNFKRESLCFGAINGNLDRFESCRRRYSAGRRHTESVEIPRAAKAACVPLNSTKNQFVIEKDGGPVPVEVKAGNGATVSLDTVLARKDVPYGYKFVDGNVGVSDKKITLPHYMAMFVKKS